jgi:hypothetical protein
MPLTVKVTGSQQAIARLERQARNAQAFGRARVVVGSPLQYAYGIETGRHRSGSLARRAGGAHFLARALEATRGEIRALIRRGGALEDGRRLLLALGFKVEARAKALVPVVTGTLRRSIVTRERS